MRNLIALVLGGGVGSRLYPLTGYRSKPAVPLAGKYRLIDIPISNCINSDINSIYLLTQFNSVSLHRHIRQTYKFDTFSAGFVEILAAQQTLEGADWYQGTADAVRKQIKNVEQHGIEYVLILSGDQLYRMNFQDMLETHIAANADVTISTVPVTQDAASAFGIMRLDDTGQVRGFLEKPKTPEELEMVRTDAAWISSHGVESRGREYLASMGIYLFNRETLVDLLEGSEYEDFGREVFPMAIRTRKVQTHLFDGYWEDIGTIRAFYEANLHLADPVPPFDLNEEDAPIYSRARFLPPTRLDGATVNNSLIADGCIIEPGARIEHSVIGLRCRIGRDVHIRDSILMGADHYEVESQLQENTRKDQPRVGIGDGTHIHGAIIDKNCQIGRGVEILGGHELADGTYGPAIVRDGVTVLPKDSVLPDQWCLAKQTREA